MTSLAIHQTREMDASFFSTRGTDARPVLAVLDNERFKVIYRGPVPVGHLPGVDDASGDLVDKGRPPDRTFISMVSGRIKA
jgi:hypothetical protein